MPLLLLLLILLAACGTKEPVAATPETPKSEALALSPEARRNAGIEVVTVAEHLDGGSLEAPGQLAWNEDRTWTVGVVATGRMRAVLAQVGDRVKAGQVLARFHTHEVHDTQANLEQALAERRRTTANLEQWKRNRDRLKRLYEAKAAPQMQVEQAESEVKMAEEEVLKAQANIERETQHLTEVLDVRVAPEHAHAGPHEGEGSDEELVPVKAPHAGLVVERKVSLGTVVTTGQPAFVIADPESLWAIASFPESALPLLRVGLPVTVEVRAYPGKAFPGRIRRLGESMDAATRTLKVVVEVATQRSLKPEMFATVRLMMGRQMALTIPASAIQEIDGKQVVFVEDAQKQFSARPVQAATRDGVAVIQSGLKAGDRVAAQGSYMIKGQAAQRVGE
ncbi:MAG: efflux RND transporter periplasmic adaptor subunit [Bryobacteraceae bacterium]|nr:efflux RND transporter periplasmic adaptor subunit [Bryobacteraceae bacterium]